MSCRFVHFGGRPGLLPRGSSGSSTAHCASERSARPVTARVSTRSPVRRSSWSLTHLPETSRISRPRHADSLRSHQTLLKHALAEDALKYLKKFVAVQPEIGVEISAMLANNAFTIYPTVERQIINFLMLEGVVQQKAIDACWALLWDTNRSSIVREFAARYLGRFSSLGDGAQLREFCEREHDEHVKRALLVACYEAGDCPQTFLAVIGRMQSGLGRAARYLQSRPSVIPCPNMETVW